ncbi:MAG: energy transducer TonB, partial [Flavobacteriales bacterium]|nr:energy transducer TonB [Flavobacteriales bacterium]
YHRVGYKVSDSLWAVNDYYRGKHRCMSGFFKDKDLKIQTGLCSNYFDNGQVSATGQFKKGKETGDWIDYWETGELDGNGPYKDGEKEGKWKWYFKTGEISAEEDYEKGELVDIKNWNVDGVAKTGDLHSMEKAEYPGGQKALLQWLNENIEYPGIAAESNIQGKVFIQFMVNIDGTISDVKTVGKVPHKSLGKEGVKK